MYAGNRFLIQTRFGVANSACDEMILTFTCIATWAICILEIAGIDVPREIEVAVHLLVEAVWACMHARL